MTSKMKFSFGEMGHLQTILIDLNRINALAHHRLISDGSGKLEAEDTKQRLLVWESVLWMAYQASAYDDDSKLQPEITKTEKSGMKDWAQICKLFQVVNKTMRTALKNASKQPSLKQSESGEFEVNE